MVPFTEMIGEVGVLTVQNARRRAVRIIVKHESYVSHMYLDSESKVTIGIGTMMPKASASAEISLTNTATKPPRAATNAEKAAEWKVLQDLSPFGTKINYAAEHYRRYTKLVITEQEAMRMLNLRMNGFIEILRSNYPGFNKFPEDAQVAMMDMTYNLGNGIHTKFVNFTRAVNRLKGPDWAEAARQSNHPQLSNERNAEIFALFMAAHRESEAKKAEARADPRRRVP